jgi:hypothetical protein
MMRAERSDETVGAVAGVEVWCPFAASMRDQDRTLCCRERKPSATAGSGQLWVVVVQKRDWRWLQPHTFELSLLRSLFRLHSFRGERHQRSSIVRWRLPWSLRPKHRLLQQVAKRRSPISSLKHPPEFRREVGQKYGKSKYSEELGYVSRMAADEGR